MAPASSHSPLDWESASWWAKVLTPVGPTVTMPQARRSAEQLRRSAAEAPGIVAGVTGLEEASDIAQSFPKLVVDRARWSQANVEMFADLTAPHLPHTPNLVARQGAAMELGGLLGLLSTRVLGQFDPFSGRLYLVAPNIIEARRTLGVDPEDFAMWVALHEQTHAVQFAAAPWLPAYMRRAMGELMESMTEDQWTRVWRTIRNLPGLIRGSTPTQVGILTDAALTPHERTLVERITATMSMLEGHADVVMDSASGHIPSTDEIRRKFTRRRSEPGGAAGIVRRLIGMDAKLRQYSDGAAFVGGVVAMVGHEGFNLAFAGEANLPTPAEIADPARWVDRVAS